MMNIIPTHDALWLVEGRVWLCVIVMTFQALTVIAVKQKLPFV